MAFVMYTLYSGLGTVALPPFPFLIRSTSLSRIEVIVAFPGSAAKIIILNDEKKLSF